MKRFLRIAAMLAFSVPGVFAQTWNGPFIAETINGTGGAIGHTSMQAVNGKPAISYYDESHKNLYFVRAANPDGSSWGTPVVIAWMGNQGFEQKLSIVNGNPAISYLDLTTKEVKFIRANDSNGDSWGPSTIVSSFPYSCEKLNFAIISGNPAVIYNENSTLTYVRSTDVNGGSWASPVSLGQTSSQTNELTMVNGSPAICYLFDYTTVKYVRATDAIGSAWGSPITMASGSNFKGYASLKVVDGFPAISYVLFGPNSLYFKRATDADGSAWGAEEVVISATQLQDAQLVIVNGNPAFFYSINGAYCRFLRATNASGTAWGSPVSFTAYPYVGFLYGFCIANGNPAACGVGGWFSRASDNNGSSWPSDVTYTSVTAHSGFGLSAGLVSGLPAISFNCDNKLKFGRASNAVGDTWGPPTTVVSGTYFSPLTDLQIVNGNPAIAYHNSGSEIKYVRATNSTGTSWGTPVSTIANNGNYVNHETLEVVNGNPAIAFYVNSTVHFVRATDQNGAAWGTDLTVVASGDPYHEGYKIPLKIVAGNPAIAYRATTATEIRIIRASDANGSSWNSPVTVIADNPISSTIQMAIVNGNPAVIYCSYYTNNILFLRADDAEGTSWPTTPIVVAAGVSDVKNFVLEVIAGKPALLYQTGNFLKTIFADNALGSSWGTPQNIYENIGGNSNPQIATLFSSSTNIANVAFRAKLEEFPLFTSAEIALPLELTAFRAFPKKSGNELNWQTASEQNTHQFELERSPDGLSSFEKIGETPAAGQSTELKNYEYLDREPLPESSYRLKMVDTDGQFEYSKIVFVKRNDRQTLQLFPNPILENDFEVQFDAPEGDLSVAVFDALGRLVFEEKIESSGGFQTRKMHIDNLQAGSYRLELRGETMREAVVFLKN